MKPDTKWLTICMACILAVMLVSAVPDILTVYFLCVYLGGYRSWDLTFNTILTVSDPHCLHFWLFVLFITSYGFLNISAPSCELEGISITWVQNTGIDWKCLLCFIALWPWIRYKTLWTCFVSEDHIFFFWYLSHAKLCMI